MKMQPYYLIMRSKGFEQATAGGQWKLADSAEFTSFPFVVKLEITPYFLA